MHLFDQRSFKRFYRLTSISIIRPFFILFVSTWDAAQDGIIVDSSFQGSGLKRGSNFFSMTVQTHPVATRTCIRYRLDTEEECFLTSRCSLVNICSTFVWHIRIYIRLVSATSYYWTSIRTFRRNFYHLYVSASSRLILRLLKHDLLELELKLDVSRIW